MTALPIVVSIDIEPDRRIVARHRPEPLVGFEKLLTLLPAMRDRLAEATGMPPSFTWPVRIDPQIEDAYGSVTALAERYEREIDDLRRAGDEIGLHPHSWRWLGQWVNDHADVGWVAHCIDVGIEGYREVFGRTPAAFSHGDRFMSNAVARQIDDAGIAVDLTVEPGLRAIRSLMPNEATTGWLPDTRTAPTRAYRPARHDFREPDTTRDDGVLFLPLTPGLRLSVRPIGDRLYPTVSHERLEPWMPPAVFRDSIALNFVGWPPTHVGLDIRSDIGMLADEYAAVEANLLALAQLVDDGVTFCTASTAHELLAGPLSPAEQEEDRAQHWLLGRNDPGYRHGIQLDTINLADRDVAPLVVDGPTRPLLVSAVIPVFDAGPRLREAVASVMDQTVPPDELIIVDDGSTDPGALDFVDMLAPPFPIRVLRQPNAGQSAARNRGAAAARGDLLAFLDQDDRWHPRHLELLCPALVKDPEVNWAYSDFDEIDADGNDVSRLFLQCHGVTHPKQVLHDCIDRDLMVLPSASVVRCSAFEALGGFDEQLRGYEDDDLYVRAFRAGWRFAFRRESLTEFRVHGTSDSTHERFVESRRRFAAKLRAEIRDDPRMQRYYFRDFVAPRFFQTSLDDYVRAVSAKDWPAARRARAAVRHFGRLRRPVPRLRLTLLRSPRLFRRLLQVNDALPERLKLSKSKVVRVR